MAVDRQAGKASRGTTSRAPKNPPSRPPRTASTAAGKKTRAKAGSAQGPAPAKRAPARRTAAAVAQAAPVASGRSGAPTATRPDAPRPDESGAQAMASALGAAALAAQAARSADPFGLASHLPPFPNNAMLGMMPPLGASVQIDPQKLTELQADYLKRFQTLMESAGSQTTPALADRRFADVAWRDNGLFSWGAALYLLNSEFMQKLADSVEGDNKTRERIRFATDQWVSALSPANFFVTNPEAQQRLLDTHGASLRAGIEQLLGDMQRGRIQQTDESAFEVGRNLAVTPGAVVFRNELIELIQYSPDTPKVGSRPLLLVPPCINKFYVMDLQPENSLVRFAVSHGHTVFLVSWRNVGADQGNLTYDDYLEHGVIRAIAVVREITKQKTINALGFCVGGTLLASGLAVLAARGEKPVHALTLMTTLLDFTDTGTLDVFIDEAYVRFREQTIGDGGLMAGKDLALTFNALRPNDLIWNYVVSKYLKGNQPPPFDILYWNSDSTNIPGPFYCWYVRHMYLQNELRVPDRLTCCGQPIDLGRLDMPVYLFAAREDHIVPWRSGYMSARLFKGPVRFTLGASGHIAGAINPASKNKRSYWISDTIASSADQWFAGSREVPGSWWNDWAQWLDQHRGELRAAPGALGSGAFPPLEPAPGSYVKVRII